MPVRQDTFKLVPTTLVNTTGPRPPMTSKAAKKAYREATKLPKVSKAEQRRIEAAEIARQKKEYEKEKATAKSKAAREKKLKKEADERAKRKELGLPEPSRFVRPSQPTIKTFVKSGAGRKRSWEEVDRREEDDADNGIEGDNECESKQQAKNTAKRTVLEQVGEDSEFGDFPPFSQADLPTLFVESEDTSRTVPIGSSPRRSPIASIESQFSQCEATDNFLKVDQVKLDAERAKSQLMTKAMLAKTIPTSVHQYQSPTTVPNTALSSHGRITDTLAISPCNLPRRNALKTTTQTIQRNWPSKLADESSRTMRPPAVPMTVNRLRSRIPLRDVSRNMVPPPRPPNAKAVTSTTKVRTKSEQIVGQQNFSMPPPSTLAFLEAHLEDFFPSPSQQVRELFEDIDDMPSNTQIAREIDVEQERDVARPPIAPVSMPTTQPLIEDEALHFLSSQDLEISSQDLRDIDTPSKPVQRDALPKAVTNPHRFETEKIPPPPPTPRLKPRFFEEKEDDLLYAALHESLLLAKQTTQGSSPRRSQRVLRRTRSVRTDHGGDDYGSDIDADLLALSDYA